MAKRTLILFILLCMGIGTLQAKMYRWTDADGQTVYSQSPPPSGEAKEIKPPPPPPSTAPPPAPAPTLSSPASSGGSGDSEEQEKSEEQGPTKEDIAESDKLKKKNCEAVTHNLDLYKNLGRKLIKTQDGLFKRPSEEERQAEIKKNQDLQKEYCN